MKECTTEFYYTIHHCNNVSNELQQAPKRFIEWFERSSVSEESGTGKIVIWCAKSNIIIEKKVNWTLRTETNLLSEHEIAACEIMDWAAEQKKKLIA